jgi:DNA-binding NarL/FixJ family response regulator
MKIDGPLRILSVCDDEGLRSSRELVLQLSGYEIESHSSDDYFLMERVTSFDLAIICHSVNQRNADQLIKMLSRFNPTLRVLHLSRVSGLDSISNGQPRPDSLLKAVRSSLMLKTTR